MDLTAWVARDTFGTLSRRRALAFRLELWLKSCLKNWIPKGPRQEGHTGFTGGPTETMKNVHDSVFT